MSAILLEQEIVHYEVLGRGRPLIFLHSWVGSWRYWVPAMQSAASSYRAYALDFWGFGDTAKDARRYSLDQQVALLDRFLEQMGIARTALIGHGLGAVVAAVYAAQHPDYVDRVMAVSLPLSEQGIHPRLRNALPAELADWLLTRRVEFEPARGEAGKTDPAALAASYAAMSAFSAQETWRTTTGAVLLVHGQTDPLIPAPSAEQLGNLPENTHAVLFEQSGHFPMLEESSKFNRLLADFLSLPSGESPRTLQLKEEWKRRMR